MDVTANQFPYEAIKILQEIADAHFVAFDFEFSGIAGRRFGRGKPTLQEYYHDVKVAAERYQVLQVGLTIVKEDLKKGRYVVRPYNFSLSPIPALKERTFSRDWVSSSGAVSFLSRNGFRFDNAINAGVRYLSRKEEQMARGAMIKEQIAKSALPDLEIKPDDAPLVKHIRDSVQEWLAVRPQQREEYLNIPGVAPGVPQSLNNRQIRLTHQIVGAEFIGLETTRMNHFIQITAPTPEAKMSAQLATTENREKTISRAVGFRWIVEALVGGNVGGIPDDYLAAGLPNMDLKGQTPKQFMAKLQERLRKRKQVVIGHNCFTDLIYFYRCFIGDLPETVQDFKEEIGMLFPFIMDTKHIATFGHSRDYNTSLEDVEKELHDRQRPRIDIPTEYSSYESNKSYHEAGYDSLLTANIAIRLSAKMEHEGKYRESIKPPDFNSMLPALGVDEDGYVTATESAQHSRASSVNGIDASSEEIKNPTTAIQTILSGSAGAWPEVEGPGSSRIPEIVAVKESKSSWREKDEVDKLKHRMANTNIYAVLEGDESNMPNQDADLMTFSSSSDEEGVPAKGLNLSSKVKNGELMPRWSADLWTMFGNTLQVNGSQEGYFKLR